MGTLIGYELKKILGKKSTLVAFSILFICHIVFVCISGSLGSTYVDDEFYETHYERNQINRENGIAIIIGLLFAARLVEIPLQFGIISQIWNYLPINLLKIDQGFTDLRLVNLFGLQFTTWQFAPILYLILVAVIIWGGSKVYKNYQVSGR